MHKGVRVKMQNATLIERVRAASHAVGQRADPSTWDSWTMGAIAGGAVGAVLILWFLAWLCCCRRREESQRVMRRRGECGDWRALPGRCVFLCACCGRRDASPCDVSLCGVV